MPDLILVRGIPGSGKSTWAAENFPNHHRPEADDWFYDWDQPSPVYKFERDQVYSAHAYCHIMTERFLDDGLNTIVCNTFITRAEILPYKQIWGDLAFVNFKVYRMLGDFGNTHNVPEHVVARMRQSIQDWPGETLVDPAPPPQAA